MKEAIVLRDAEDERDILQNGEDLFSRLYALRKILNKKDGEELKQKINEEYKVGCICFIIIYIEIKVRI